MRGRLLDIVLIAAAIVGAIWLAALIYHNHLGGHVESAAAPTTTAPAAPGNPEDAGR